MNQNNDVTVKKKIAFPIAAIFFLLHMVMTIVVRSMVVGELPVFALLFEAMLVIILMMRKNDILLVGALFFWGVFSVGSTISLFLALGEWVDLSALGSAVTLFPATVGVLALSTLGLKNPKICAYEDILKKAFYALFAVSAAWESWICISTFFNSPGGVEFYYVRYVGSIFALVAIYLLGKWILSPYAEESEKTDSETCADEFYVSLGKHICLLLFTFGVWMLMWTHKVTRYTNRAGGEEYRNPTNKLLLCMFVPFYSIYWTYKTAQRIDKIAKDSGLTSDLGSICLILAIFVPFVPPILMQEKINGIPTGSSKESVPEIPVKTEDRAEAPKASSDRDELANLERYKELLDKGIITEEEFEAKKKQALGL